MPRRRAQPAQLTLFTPEPAAASRVVPAPVPADVQAVGAAMPAGLYLGTSTWSFPGWRGIVWEGRYSTTVLAREGLPAYAAHPVLTAAGIDRSYYQPLSADDFATYAAQVPAGFRFVVKAHEALTLRRYPEHERYGSRRGEPSPQFLDAAYATDEVVGPTAEGLGETLGVLVFQLAPQELGPPLRFVEQLFRFLGALPKGPRYAVEVRNRDVLCDQYALALADAGASPCLTVYPGMPDVVEQWTRTGAVARAADAALVVRWMLRPGLTYQSAYDRYYPFDRRVDDDGERRGAVAALARKALAHEMPVFVTVNNKAEGSAPLSLIELARAIGKLG